LVSSIHFTVSPTQNPARRTLQSIQGLAPPELNSKNEYSQEGIEKKKLEEEKDGDRTIIGNLMWHAVDPQTGVKFSPNDLLANANIFV
jgi:hypothetical protein